MVYQCHASFVCLLPVGYWWAEKNTRCMKKIVLLFLLLAIGTIAFSQEITVRFTGQLNGTSYCRLDSVKVTNLTRNWTETVEYPDTIIVLGGTVGTELNIAATQGLGQNIPNPFDCETRVELSVSQREDVRMQLLDVAGKLYAEYKGSLNAGLHTFDISAANPQTYLLIATVGDRQYSIRMVNVGSGCGSSIKYAGSSNGIVAKLTSTNEFLIGDNMRYVGYATIGGMVVASDVKEQAQVVSQYVTLNFTHYSRPTVETLATTDITITSATLHGNITDAGGTAVTSRGFYYGTDADNLSQILSAGSGNGEYSKTLSGLSVATTYYYCAFATNSAGTAIGEVMSFTSLDIVPPTVQTNAATSISTTGATLNGNVTTDGGATVTARGFVYGTSASNLSQNVQSGTGTGSFTKSLTGLSHSTTYYYKAYATNAIGTNYGEVKQFTTSSYPQGAIGGVFSTSSTKQVYFSQGNLQYNPSTQTWQFAANQYDIIGSANSNISPSYSGWIDLFGWGTGSNPTNSITGSSNYSTFTDWGNNAISNGGNQGGLWRTLSSSEWDYLLHRRPNAFSLSGGATVNGVIGLVILPDNWTLPSGCSFTSGTTYTTSQWATMESAGAVFLPAAGYRIGTGVIDVGSSGYYWSSTADPENSDNAKFLVFSSSSANSNSNYYRHYGRSVRLVWVVQN